MITTAYNISLHAQQSAEAGSKDLHSTLMLITKPVNVQKGKLFAYHLTSSGRDPIHWGLIIYTRVYLSEVTYCTYYLLMKCRSNIFFFLKEKLLNSAGNTPTKSQLGSQQGYKFVGELLVVKLIAVKLQVFFEPEILNVGSSQI